MVEHRDPPVAFAATGRVRTAESDRGAIAAVLDHRRSPQSPVAAGVRDDDRWRAKRHLRKCGLRAKHDVRAFRIGRERELHRLEVDEQRVGSDVVRL